MKTLLAVTAAVLLASPVGAEPLAAAFSEVMEPRQVVSLRDVGACFERGPDAVADLLGLPARFCVKRVGTTMPEDAITPFEWNGYGIVEGAPAAGARKHISGGSRRSDGGWDIVVDLFSAPGRKPRCGSLDRAFAAIYFSVDAVGRPLPGPVEVRGFMMDGSSDCREQARSTQIDYRLVP
jgi:hypothetical protein